MAGHKNYAVWYVMVYYIVYSVIKNLAWLTLPNALFASRAD